MPSKELRAARATGTPDLEEVARLALFAAVGGGLIFSLAVAIELGAAAGSLCLLGTAALCVVSLPIALRRTSLLEPIWLVVLVTGIGITGKCFYVSLGPQERVGFLLLGKTPEDLHFAALVMAAAMLCLAIGYLLADVEILPGALAPFLKRGWNPRRLWALLGVLLLVGIVSFALFAWRMEVSIERLSDLSSKRWVQVEGARFRSSMGYLRWGAEQIELAFYLALVWWAAKSRRLLSLSTLALAGLALLASAFPIFVSSRQGFLFLIFRILVVWMILRGQPKLRHAAALAAIGFVVMSSMLALRRGAADWDDVGRYLDAGEFLEVTIGGRHFLDLTKTAHVLDGVPEVVDYRYGTTLLTWVAAPVPRSMWPQKPAIGVGIELGPAIFHTHPRTGVAPGLIGELYLNFGLAGIFVGMLVFGSALRIVYATFGRFFPHPTAVLLYAILLPHLSIAMLSSSVSGSMARLLQELVPLLLATWILGAGEGVGRRVLRPAPGKAGAPAQA